MTIYNSADPVAEVEDGAFDWGLPSVVEALRQSREVTDKVRHRGHVRELPSRTALVDIVGSIAAALFPTHYGRPDLTDETIDYFVGASLQAALAPLAEQVRRSLTFERESDLQSDAAPWRQAQRVIGAFARELPAMRALLVQDLLAAYQGDPAATSISEILLCYPGFNAVLHYRLAHILHRAGIRFLARVISNIGHAATGIDIHPGARIGPGFFIDHGTGVVIGETAIIGRNVRLYQAVTLGARRLPADAEGALIKGQDRHPILEDDVVIYAGATILGRITVGRGSTIGGNVWLTQSVPAGSVVTQARTLQDRGVSLPAQ